MTVTEYAEMIIDKGSCYSGAEVMFILSKYEEQEALRKEKEAKLKLLKSKMAGIIDKEVIEWRESMRS